MNQTENPVPVLSKAEQEIMQFIRDHAGKTPELVAGNFASTSKYKTSINLIHSLLGEGLLRKDAGSRLSLTPRGEATLARLIEAQREAEARRAEQEAEKRAAEAVRLQERHEDYANEERRYRTNNKVTVVTALCTFVAGLLVEHFAGIVGFILHLFH